MGTKPTAGLVTALMLAVNLLTGMAAPDRYAVIVQDTTQPAARFVEDAPNGMTRFFYDDYYYLADKECQFKAIERVGYFDRDKRVFAGEFTDFDNAGRVVLRGSYRDGRKHGLFRAYHPNGQLKWEVNFAEDLPQGMWKYYYPDGKPLLEVEYRGDGLNIRNYWDRRGRQRVADGEGRYEFEIEADGYNEFGYLRYNRRGKVVNGQPHGAWIVEYVFEDGKTEGAGHEYYQHGKFLRGYDAYRDEEFFNAPRYGILPVNFFLRAVELIGKACTIDEYSGFTGYLSRHLEEWFEGELDEMPDPVKVEFTIDVNENGAPGPIDMKRTFSQKRYATLLLEAIRAIAFWFPSYAGETYIDDKLTVTVEAFPDAAEQKLRFFDTRIKRERGI